MAIMNFAHLFRRAFLALTFVLAPIGQAAPNSEVQSPSEPGVRSGRIGLIEYVQRREMKAHKALAQQLGMSSSSVYFGDVPSGDEYTGEDSLAPMERSSSSESKQSLSLTHSHANKPDSAGNLQAPIMLASSAEGSNSSNAEYTQADKWVWTSINISGAPSGSSITSVEITYNVDSNYTTDIAWYLENYGNWESPEYSMPVTGDDLWDGYSETSEKTYAIYPAAGTPVNGTWYFNVQDTYNDSDPNWNKGRIDWWEITIYYEEPETVSKPSVPSGPSSGETGESLSYSTSASSNKGHTLQYRYDWGDGTVSSWGSSARSHSYSSPGTKYIYAQARCQSHTSIESVWSDSKQVTIARAPAGQIVSVSPDNFSGTARTVTVTVKNTGRDDANLIVECASYPSGWSVNPSDKQTNLPYNTTNSTYFTFTVTPPSSSDSSGTIVWNLYFDRTWPTDNQLLDTADQSVVNTIPRPDLIVESLWTVPASPVEGQSYVIKATVRNQGNAAANPTGFDQYINGHFYIDSTDAGGEQEWCTSIAANGTYTFSSASRTAPAPGSHTIRAVADSQGDVAESNEGNNEKSVDITVQSAPKPDLIVESLWTVPASPVEGQSYVIKATVRNQGNAAANPTGFDQYINGHFYIDSTDAGGEQEWCTSIAANGTYTFSSASRTAPAPGSHTIRAVADSQGDVAESIEGNNEGTGNITVLPAPKPDLVVTDILLDNQSTLPIVQQGDDVRLDFDVLNQGAAGTGPDVHIRWYWGTNQGSTANYIAEGSVGTLNGLAGGESERETDASWVIPGDLSPGTYWLTAVIDWDQRVPESLDNNNTRSESFTVVAPSHITGIDKWWAYSGGQHLVVSLGVTIGQNAEYKLDIDVEGLNAWELSPAAYAQVDGGTSHMFDPYLGVANLGALAIGSHTIQIHDFVSPALPEIERIRFQLWKTGLIEPTSEYASLFVADRRGLTDADLSALMFVDAAGGQLPITTVQGLVDQFAPRLYFDSQENYFPQSIATTLAEVRCGQVPVLRDSAGNQLVSQPNSAGLLAAARQYGCDENLDDLWLDLPCAAPAPTGSITGGNPFPLYATAVRDGDTIAISYLVHYGYSNWKQHGGVNNHEGDWEGGFVYLKQNAAGQPFYPYKVAYSQHEKCDLVPGASPEADLTKIETLSPPGTDIAQQQGSPEATDTCLGPGGEWAWWSDLYATGLVENETHPRLFVGRGGHASYFYPDKRDYSLNTAWFIEYFDGQSTVAPAQATSVILLPRVPDAVAAGFEWLVVPMHWGQADLPDSLWGNKGPLGPVFARANYGNPGVRWFDPVGWPTDGWNFGQWEPPGDLASFVSISDSGLLPGGQGQIHVTIRAPSSGSYALAVHDGFRFPAPWGLPAKTGFVSLGNGQTHTFVLDCTPSDGQKAVIVDLQREIVSGQSYSVDSTSVVLGHRALEVGDAVFRNGLVLSGNEYEGHAGLFWFHDNGVDHVIHSNGGFGTDGQWGINQTSVHEAILNDNGTLGFLAGGTYCGAKNTGALAASERDQIVYEAKYNINSMYTVLFDRTSRASSYQNGDTRFRCDALVDHCYYQAIGHSFWDLVPSIIISPFHNSPKMFFEYGVDTSATPPTVVLAEPVTEAMPTAPIVIEFSELMGRQGLVNAGIVVVGSISGTHVIDGTALSFIDKDFSHITDAQHKDQLYTTSDGTRHDCIGVRIQPATAFSPGETVTVTIPVSVKDLGGNPLAAAYSWSFAVAATPTVHSLTINNGEGSTASRIVTLNNACSNAPVEYVASESPDFSGAQWKPYSTNPSFTLASGNGLKTVFFKVRNATGESEPLSDTIDLNETGSLKVTIMPQQAIDGGAMWRIDNTGQWYQSGETAEVGAENHEITFTSIPGWIRPEAEVVNVLPGQLNELTRSYTQKRYALSVIATPAGGGLVTMEPLPDGDGQYGHGTVVRLTAVPAFGYQFYAWGGDAFGSFNPTSVTMTDNKMVTAAFGLLNVPGPTVTHVWQDNGAVRGGPATVNPDGPASVEARTKGITSCTVQFSEDVFVQQSDVSIRDLQNTTDLVAPSTFQYDSGQHTLTMTWAAGTFTNRWIRIHIKDTVTSVATGAALDGEVYMTSGTPTSGLALNGQMPTGNATAGGTAMFVLGALIGDVNGDGQVRSNDQAIVRNNLNSTADIPSDVNGDGQVRSNDQALVRNNLNAALPPVPAP